MKLKIYIHTSIPLLYVYLGIYFLFLSNQVFIFINLINNLVHKKFHTTYNNYLYIYSSSITTSMFSIFILNTDGKYYIKIYFRIL